MGIPQMARKWRLARQLRGNTRNPPSGAECAASALQQMNETKARALSGAGAGLSRIAGGTHAIHASS
jgi:hypothetical protein